MSMRSEPAVDVSIEPELVAVDRPCRCIAACVSFAADKALIFERVFLSLNRNGDDEKEC